MLRKTAFKPVDCRMLLSAIKLVKIEHKSIEAAAEEEAGQKTPERSEEDYCVMCLVSMPASTPSNATCARHPCANMGNRCFFTCRGCDSDLDVSDDDDQNDEK